MDFLKLMNWQVLTLRSKSIWGKDGKIKPSVRKRMVQNQLNHDELVKYLSYIYIDKKYDQYELIGLNNACQYNTTAVYNRADNMLLQNLILYRNHEIVLTCSPYIFYMIVDEFMSTFEQTETGD